MLISVYLFSLFWLLSGNFLIINWIYDRFASSSSKSASLVFANAQVTFDRLGFEEIYQLSQQGNGRFLLLAMERLGLANRLRTMADWYGVATNTNRTLVVSWRPTADCNIDFYELFEHGAPGLFVLTEPLPIKAERDAYLSPYVVSGKVKQLVTERDIWANPTLAFMGKPSVFLDSIPILITDYDGEISLEGVPCIAYTSKHRFFHSHLVPKTEYQDLVNAFWEEHFLSKGVLGVGVHYRAKDSRFDWAVIPPFGGSNRATDFGEGATLQDFVAAMLRIALHFTYEAPSTTTESGALLSNRRRPLIRFFLASNSEEAKNQLIQLFAVNYAAQLQSRGYSYVGYSGETNVDGMILSIKHSTYTKQDEQGGQHLMERSHKQGMIAGFIDWLLLSRTSLLLNTYGSSFALEASYFSQSPSAPGISSKGSVTQHRITPIVGIWSGMLVHHDSNYLPFCGVMQYAKHLSASAMPVKFTEGTIDNRQVSFMVTNCLHFM